jgi:hypothetical protein
VRDCKIGSSGGLPEPVMGILFTSLKLEVCVKAGVTGSKELVAIKLTEIKERRDD